ncbi:efflux RND transporter periplasmic adaptor subunit [Tenacibaculum maritimum]|uniref:efflux RND transporter periplasmic adaptor subunit n=1 Tax=Tenacibaculum maritimum TaxID=107401 RepID=UPI0012E4586D|nr:efflux RND transporter periplasmic adaptor subunit [Tenacibaculum maritimum]CAA0152129.1 conserved hypothetical protein [Tenacibaculum maritimum]CAA0188068.1 putative RND family efflux transporter MFP subunit lipoprotein precursor [Tenacibaculum maritimum]
MRKVLFIVLFFCISCKNRLDKEVVKGGLSKVKQKEVEVNILKETLFVENIISNGKITFQKKNELYFKLNNQLVSLRVKNGEKVSKGQVLALLENDVLKNNLEKAKIKLQKASNKFVEERINYDEEESNSTILETLEIKSGVLEAKNNLESAQIKYDQTILKAPFSGIIANLEKREGDFITTADAFCTIINPDTLEILFYVLENEFGFISKGKEIEIQPFANKDQHFKGIITEINPIVDKNGLIKIKAKIISNNTGLLDGMNVKVFINKELKNVLVIPKKALVLRSNQEVVFTLEKGLAKWNYVEVVGENNDSYAIKKGLKVSDTIIVSGNLNLSHDAKVHATFVEGYANQK